MFKPCLAIAAGALVSVFSITQPANSYEAEPRRIYAQNSGTEFPITSITFVPTVTAGQNRAVLIVPDRDTTQSANGGLLRRYDVHLAKMFELSNLYCAQANGYTESMEWHYFAGNGDINMGRFLIDCKLVRDIVNAYGLGRSERTRIVYSATGTTTTRDVPVLNIVGGKIPKFVEFVRGFRPVGDAQRLDQAQRATQPYVEMPEQSPNVPREPAPSKTEFPITSIRFLPALNGGQARAVFIVPDRDTSQPAYGGSLTRYDVHVAKMFELSNLYCNQANGNWDSVEWNYFAGDGNINGGRFVFSCQLVRDIVSAYGLGRSEQTRVAYSPTGAETTENVPVLNLVGSKIPKFISFVKGLRSTGVAQRIDRQ
jgi:serine/threonine-protein kinase